MTPPYFSTQWKYTPVPAESQTTAGPWKEEKQASSANKSSSRKRLTVADVPLIGDPCMIYGKIVRCALLILFASLLPACAFAAKYPRPPGSPVLKMTADQCSDGTADEDSSDTEYGERALLYHQADLLRKRNIRLEWHLSPRRRALARRCQAAFDNLMKACFAYHFAVQDGTMVYDFYAAQEPDNEFAMERLIRDLGRSGQPDRLSRLRAQRDFRKARTHLQKTYALIPGATDSFAPLSERLSDYANVKAALRRAKKVLDSLPDGAKPEFAHEIEQITYNLDIMLIQP